MSITKLPSPEERAKRDSPTRRINRTILDAVYKINHVGEDIDERLKFMRRKVRYEGYHHSKGYTNERHLRALERTWLIECA